QQNRRGRTVMKDVHALHPDDLLFITFNERGQPYGDFQPVLANYVGTIARNGTFLPLSFLDWRKMPKNRLEEAWKLVIARFCIPNKHKNFVMQMMGVAWRRWRTEVKSTSYDSNTPLQDLMSIRPVPHKLAPEVWERLCQYWKANERISKQNRDNAKKKGSRAQGRTSIPSLEDKFVFYSDVFGLEHSGRVRCLGAGATPSQVFPDQCRRSSLYRPSDNSAADVTENLRAMEEKMKKDMEARESQWQAQRKRHNFR
ncbi:hypothetical protein F511_23321, partial [Dorcoceras hygrometricum]